MAIEKIAIQEFLKLRELYPVIDVRSPGEYNHAHIPGAYSLPLFTDEERKVVGTAYKQQSKQTAIKEGLQYFGGKMVDMIEQVEKIVAEHTFEESATKEKSVIVHCWRGGMRSAGVAWLLNLYGFKVYTIVGGYKYFRRWCIAQFDKPYAFNIISGFTGSGKTALLKVLREAGQETICLESLAGHKGSAFGNLLNKPQPSQEMFENILALALLHVENQGSIWIEDESQRIGTVNIPTPLYKHIQTKQLYFLQINFDERLQHVVEEYGQFDKELLQNAIMRITKRLGGLETKTALAFLEAGDIAGCFRVLLKYYDKQYLKGFAGKEKTAKQVIKIDCVNTDALMNADILLRKYLLAIQTQ